MAAYPPPDATLARLRARNPLVHCLTNPVAAALTANALLAVGASPLMAEAEAEMADIAGFTDALLVNIGMQTDARMRAAAAAVAGARARRTPWVLDPVAAGAISARTALARQFAEAGPSVIKGNASEILALAGEGRGGRGTDATDETAIADGPARRLASRTGAIVAVTGAVDLVTDGERLLTVERGDKAMMGISGLGCVAGALMAACIAVEPDPLVATAHALTLLGVAGERAAARVAGPGSLAPALLDALAMSGEGGTSE